MTAATPDRIEKQISINAPLPRVWKALTDHKEFGSWFRVNLEGPFIPGKPTKGRITHPGYEHVVMEVLVEKLQPQTYFSFRWRPYAVDPRKDYSLEDRTLVEFRLEPAGVGGGGTTLRVTESGFDRVPPGRRDEAFRMNSGGWDAQVQNIARYAESTPAAART